jgi:hypothetical protein
MVAFQRLNICYSSNSSATLASSVAIPRYLPLQIVRYNHQVFCLFKISKQRSAEPATKISAERVKKRSAFATLAALCSIMVAVLLILLHTKVDLGLIETATYKLSFSLF